jgi:hypothetical protein
MIMVNMILTLHRVYLCKKKAAPLGRPFFAWHAMPFDKLRTGRISPFASTVAEALVDKNAAGDRLPPSLLWSYGVTSTLDLRSLGSHP